MADQRVEVGSVRLAVRESGRGQARVFLHYGGGNLAMWEAVMPAFERDARCIRLDLRGHGRSDAPASGYRLEDMAGDVVGLLDRLDVGAAHLVGSSLGAEVALAMASRHPDRVLSLVLDGAFASEYGPYGLHAAADLAQDPETQRELDEQQARPDATYPSAEAYLAKKREVLEQAGLWNDAVEAVARYGIAQLPDGTFANAWRKWARDEYMRHYYAARFETYYAAVRCPVLLLPGSREMEDALVAKAVSAFRELAGHCEVVQVAGAEHPFGWLMIPAAMADAVLAFYARIRDG